MKIAIGGDHAGFEYKTEVKAFLESEGYSVEDFGPFSNESADYPDFVHPAVKSVLSHENELCVLICGSGNGVAMTANKYADIRAAVCWNTELAALARQHNNANVLCMGSRFVSLDLAKEMTSVFVSERFEGGRHQRRVDKINC